MIAKDDNELVYEVISGNVRAFEFLVERYQKKIYKMVLRMVGDTETAKDLTQDIFVKVYEKLGSFNARYRFFSWIYRIAINDTISWIRHNPRNARLMDDQNLLMDESDFVQAEDRIRMLGWALEQLAADYRILIVLKYYDGLSYEEVARTTELPVEKVRSRLFIAREKLRRILLQKGFLDYE